MTSVWMPPGQQTFFDLTGKPLSLGSIELYIPTTYTPKLSWADEAQSVVNQNPLPLDASGSAPIWGIGLYRMIAKDEAGATVFDKITGFVASGGGGGTVFGPGVSVSGNITTWTSTDGTQIGDGGIALSALGLKSLSNVTAGDMTGSLRVRGSSDPWLFYIDPVADQVSIGSGGVVDPFRKLTVNLTTNDMTVAGDIGHAGVESVAVMTGLGTAAVNPDGLYGRVWYQPLTGTANFIGSGAAVRGNAYTIDTAFAANVLRLIGVYGRPRHENSLGVVTDAVSIFADAAQKGVSGGTITNAYLLYGSAQTLATNNYGIFLENDPNKGGISSANGIPISIAPGGNKLISFTTGGLASLSIASAALIGYEAKNTSTGAGVVADYNLQTGTSGSTADLSLQDNTGSPYFLGALGSAVQGWYWNGPAFVWRDNSGIQYGQVTSIGAAFTGFMKTTGKLVSALTAAATAGAGARDFVTDATTTVILGLGLVVAGSGGNKVPVYSDGTDWRIG